MMFGQQASFHDLSRGGQNLTIHRIKWYLVNRETLQLLLAALIRKHRSRAVQQRCSNFVECINTLVRYQNNGAANYFLMWKHCDLLLQSSSVEFLHEMAKYVEDLVKNPHLQEQTVQWCITVINQLLPN